MPDITCRITRLQNDEQRIAVVGIEFLLQFGELFDVSLNFFFGIFFVDTARFVGGEVV
jgi:hypothetical protein